MAENDLTGRTMLITGATGGIGLAAARALARRGAAVLMVGHHPDRDRDVVAGVIATTGNSRVTYYQADLAVQDEVRRLAREIQAQQPRLDVLINNVGGFLMQRELTPDGYEMTFALNHLNTFLLTYLLLDLLQAGAPARIINVASDAHRGSRLDFTDLQGERSYRGFRAYSRSKLAMVMITYALARRLEGTGVTVNAVHPGFVMTGLYRHMPGLLGAIARPIMSLFARSTEKGAETLVYLAAAPDVAGASGAYWVDKQQVASSPASHDVAVQEQLWDVTMAMAGLDQPNESSDDR